MFDQDENDTVAVLLNTQRRLDQRLKRVFDADTCRILQQAQVHIHEALLLLGCEYPDDSGGGFGVSSEPGEKRGSQQQCAAAGGRDAGRQVDRVPDHPEHQSDECQGRNGVARHPVRPFELRLAYSQDNYPGDGERREERQRETDVGQERLEAGGQQHADRDQGL